MISKILVAVDGSKNADKAFEYACDLAEKAEASLLILHVSEELGTVGYSINKEIERDISHIIGSYMFNSGYAALFWKQGNYCMYCF